ncbi:MAG: DUF5106 domain-containing protein [Muribaculaceae bacterium]|nr:DUF5106 domain-containing protein [Muribaculaceae bacterium]
MITNSSKFKLRFLSLTLAISLGVGVEAQSMSDQIVIPPLFEYPMAPESLPDLQTKSDWLMDHFWDSMDFTNPGSVNQSALNDAMNVYGAAAMYASKSKAKSSVENLVKNLKGNPTLMFQFAKGAEEVFYGPRAIAWIDELYIPFLKGVLSEKSISSDRKRRYEDLLIMLQKNALGAKFADLRLTLSNGRHKEFHPETPLTLIEFGNPDCDDCKFARMKLEMASDLMEMVDSKELQIAFIVADSMPEDEADVLNLLKEYPSTWTAGISYGGDDVYDIRHTPSFYIIDKKGTILEKNLDVSDAVNAIRALTSESKRKSKNKK